MSTPATAKLSGTVKWDDNSLFDGWLRLAVVLPTNSDGQWPSMHIAGYLAPQRLPLWIEVPIAAGAFDDHTAILQNSAIEPPNTQYVAYWYDRNNRRIYPTTGNNPTPFTISADPYSINVPTLTRPTTSATIPQPTDSSTEGL